MDACIGPFINIGIRIMEYLNLIDSVSTDVRKLLHKDFKSAITSLEYVQNASDNNNRKTYIMDARKSFLDATSVEENENLVSSYVGLSMCQYLLGDENNARITLEKIDTVQLTTSKKVQAMGKQYIKEVAKNIIPGYRILKTVKVLQGEIPEYKALQERVAMFDQYKMRAKSLAKSYIKNKKNK